MPGYGVVETDDEVVDGAGPAACVVAGQGEACEDLPVVEVPGDVQGEFFDLVEGAEEALRPGGATEADQQVHSLRGAVLQGLLRLLIGHAGEKDKSA